MANNKVYLLIEESWDESPDGYGSAILTDVKVLETSMDRDSLQKKLNSWAIEMGASSENGGYAIRPCAIMELRRIVEKDLVE